MTWGEFKKTVEDQFITDDDEISKIDVDVGEESIEARRVASTDKIVIVGFP